MTLAAWLPSKLRESQDYHSRQEHHGLCQHWQGTSLRSRSQSCRAAKARCLAAGSGSTPPCSPLAAPISHDAMR